MKDHSVRDLRVAIVGAGAGGLVTAYRLAQAGIEVELLEAGDSLGGNCFAVEVDGSANAPACLL